MPTKVVVATGHGVVILERQDGGWQERVGTLVRHAFTSVAADGELILAGTRDGVYRSGDQGQTWWESNEGLGHRHIRWLALHPARPGLALAGTEPAAIYRSEDGGQTWRARPEIAVLRDENDWYLPYSPEAGCVRGFALHGDRAYAAVEQGGLLRSDDYGERWRLVEGCSGDPHADLEEGMIHTDVHAVTVHPSSPDQVFAPTGGGLYYSTDGGGAWELLYRCYCRAVWVDPVRPGHIILGPADGVDRRGRIEESFNGGDTWEAAMEGVGVLAWPSHMVERFVQVEDELLAILSNGQVLVGPQQMPSWRPFLPAIEEVAAIAVHPGG